jgi:hypothetical protein
MFLRCIQVAHITLIGCTDDRMEQAGSPTNWADLVARLVPMPARTFTSAGSCPEQCEGLVQDLLGRFGVN